MLRHAHRWAAFGAAVILVQFQSGCGCGDHGTADSGTAADGGASDSGEPFGWDSGAPVTDGRDPTVAAACGEARAGVIMAGQDAALIGGTSAEGRTGAGDVALYNCKVRFVVQGAHDGDGYLLSPGSLIDADVVRPAGEPGWDPIDEFDTMFGPYTTFAATEVGVVADGSDGGPAIVRAIGTDAPLEFISGAVGIAGMQQNLLIIQDYVLEPDASVMRIDTRFVAVGPHSVPLQLGDFVLYSDDGYDPFAAPGPGFDRAGQSGLLEIAGTCGEHNEMCVGSFGDETFDFLVGSFLSGLGANNDISIFPYFIETVSIGSYSEHTTTRYVAVGADLDDVTRAYFATRGTATVEVSGTVTETGTAAPVGGARVHLVSTAGGGRSYTTFAVSAADGTWDAAVPAGDYDVIVTGSGIGQDVDVPGAAPWPFPYADGRGRGETLAVTIDGAQGPVDLTIGPAATVNLTLTDGNGGLTGGKVIFGWPASAGGGDPEPNDPMLDERNAYGFARKVAWTADGTMTVALEPGTYDVTAAHGFNAEIDARTDVVVDPASGPLDLTFDLPVVVDHDGYYAADNHEHAAPSIHGECTVEERPVVNIAEGLDFFVSADHDIVIDYQPVIERLGLGDLQHNIPGEEVSPLWGHFIPYPVTPDDTLPNHGAIPWWQGMGFTLQEIVSWSSTVLKAGLVQINHGRSSGAGYFTTADFDPVTGSVGVPGSWDDTLEVMEIVNGKGSGERESLLIDWYALLNMGKTMAGTGVSDSHHRLGGEPGYGRTYYYLPGAATIPDIDADMVAGASLGGRLIVSGGPFISVTLLGETVGGTAVPGGAGPYDLLIEVRAPQWMADVMTSVEVIANGLVEQSFVLDPMSATSPVVFSTVLPVDPSVDTWYIVRTDGGSLFPVVPGAEAFAVTNPIYLDLAGDGFDAPGL
jgi:hypothetical protein